VVIATNGGRLGGGRAHVWVVLVDAGHVTRLVDSRVDCGIGNGDAAAEEKSAAVVVFVVYACHRF
jgi:hypothetical protein